MQASTPCLMDRAHTAINNKSNRQHLTKTHGATESVRRELWKRTLLRGNGGGPSPAEVERLIARYAGEKGIVDPTNTPIAGMVATGVRHRAAEAFPWLSRGGWVR